MNILQIAKFPPTDRGGIEKLVKQISEEGVKSSNRYDVLCFDERDKSRVDILPRYTVFRTRTLFRLFSTPFSIHNLYFMRKIIHNYVIVHVHLPNPLSILYLMLSLGRQHVSVHFHADASRLKLYVLYRPIEAWILKRANLIIVTNPRTAQSSALWPYQQKIKILPLGLSRRDFLHPEIKNISSTILSISKTRYLISICRFTAYKNIPMLVDVFSRLNAIYPELRLLVVGSGQEYKQILKAIHRVNLSDCVTILEDIDDNSKRYLLQHAEALVLASTTPAEAFGYVQLEAMAMFCPVFSFDIKKSGVSWVNLSGKTGIVVPIGNNDKEASDNLYISLKIYLSSTSNRSLYALNCHEHAKKFQADRLFKELDQALSSFDS